MHQQPQGQQQSAQSGFAPLYPNGSPQRRFLSEGELLARTTSNGLSIGNELSYVNRNNNTVDNIRELAGSPQRGVYNWKDNSPPGQNPNVSMYNVVPTHQQQQQQMSQQQLIMGRPPLPQTTMQQQYLQNQNMVVVTSSQQQQQQQPRQSNVSNIINNIVANSSATGGGYHPALRGGVQVFPPQINASPQVKRKQTPTRPISFVRALEMANSIEMTNVQQQQQSIDQQMQQVELNKSNNEMQQQQQQQQQIPDRGSVYDMGVNYEISV
jgi:palmitoyltransferase ZDHHC5/8